jgi:cobalamin biosynthesis protein CobD/CbiB
MKDRIMTQLKGAGRTANSEHSTGDLVKLVAEQVSVLVRDELKLAQLEMSGKAKQAGKGAGLMGGGGLIALYGVACLIACVIIAISHVLQAWLAALIVGAALLVAAAVAALVGRSQLRKAAPPMPTEAIESVKTDVEAAVGRSHQRKDAVPIPRESIEGAKANAEENREGARQS